jgi:hypothetical protein
MYKANFIVEFERDALRQMNKRVYPVAEVSRRQGKKSKESQAGFEKIGALDNV